MKSHLYLPKAPPYLLTDDFDASGTSFLDILFLEPLSKLTQLFPRRSFHTAKGSRYFVTDPYEDYKTIATESTNKYELCAQVLLAA